MGYCVRCGRNIPDGSPGCPACGAAQGPMPQNPRPAGPGSQQKGFFALLYDFSFNEFGTPRIVKVLYIIFVIALSIGLLGVIINIMSIPAWLMDGGLKFLLAFIVFPFLYLIYIMGLRIAMEVSSAIIGILHELRYLNRK